MSRLLDIPVGIENFRQADLKERKIREEAQIIKKGQQDMRLARRAYRRGMREGNTDMMRAGLTAMDMFKENDSSGIAAAGALNSEIAGRDNHIRQQFSDYRGTKAAIEGSPSSPPRQTLEDVASDAGVVRLPKLLSGPPSKTQPGMLDSRLKQIGTSGKASPVERLAYDLSRSKLISSGDRAAMGRALHRAGTLGIHGSDVNSFVERLQKDRKTKLL